MKVKGITYKLVEQTEDQILEDLCAGCAFDVADCELVMTDVNSHELDMCSTTKNTNKVWTIVK